MNKRNWLITGLLCALFPAAQGQTPATLSGLDFGAYKTDIERLAYRFNEPFAPSTMRYTATVEASYTENIVLTPRLTSAQGVVLKINGADAKPGEETKVPLSLGENQIRIELTAPGAPPKTWEVDVTRKDLSAVYVSESIGKGMWIVKDFGGYIGNESMYLIEGANRAVLFDTGMGRGDLLAYLKTLTRLPIDVAVSHGNRDHFLQVDKFPDSTLYMSDYDVTRLPPELVTSRYKWVKDGDTIDLGGGHRFEVIRVPGHTLGSVLYVDFANRIAITGDAISSGSMVYMFASTCAALDEYLAGLKHLEDRLKKLDGITLLVGHNYQVRTPLTGAAGKQLITDMRIAAEQVLAGKAEGRLTQTMRDGRATPLRQLNVGLAGLWYNPNNLATDPAALDFLKIRTAVGQDVIPQPVFSSVQTSYNASVPGDVARVQVTPTAYWPDHRSITVNGKTVKSGQPVAADLAIGANKLDITVTSGKGAVRTYAVNLTRGSAAK